MSVPRILLLTAFIAAGTAAAQETQDAKPEVKTESPATLSVELNNAEQNEMACTLSFLVTNSHPTQIDSANYETVLFDKNGQVERLTLFDFGTLPTGRPRLRQFSLPDTKCSDLGQLLINGAKNCEAGELGADICIKSLKTSTRTDIEVIG